MCLLNWRFIMILRRNEIPRMSEDKARWKVHSELAGFKPVKLELRQSVRFPSGELVDATVVKRIPKVFILPRKVLQLGVSTAPELGSN